jgi:hypothetical protein
MLLIFTQKNTPRIAYVFKHICTRILGLEVNFTSVIEEFISYTEPKASYGKQPLGNELFFQSHGLLTQQGFETIDIVVKEWDSTKCFFSVSDKSALPFDIFSASFYLLSRYEEYLPHVKDAMGRFPATESIAFQENFLQDPVIDIWAYKLKDLLISVFPGLYFTNHKMKVHSIVEAKQPFAYKQRGFFRTSIGYVNDLFKFKIGNILDRTRVILGLRSDPLDTFKWMINVAKRSKSRLTVFFLLGEALIFEEGLNTHRQKFNYLVKFVADYKEVGLMISFEALTNSDIQKKEKKQMEEMTNRSLLSSINAQFLVSLPDVYRNLLEMEIENDFTMFYENTNGYRAGTCTPFLFYDLDYEIKTPLIIQPVAISTNAFKKNTPEEINNTINTMFSSVENLNGTFIMLFSNKDFSSSERNKIWRSVFSDKLMKYE